MLVGNARERVHQAGKIETTDSEFPAAALARKAADQTAGFQRLKRALDGSSIDTHAVRDRGRSNIGQFVGAPPVGDEIEQDYKFRGREFDCALITDEHAWNCGETRCSGCDAGAPAVLNVFYLMHTSPVVHQTEDQVNKVYTY